MERDQASPEPCKVCGTTKELALFLHYIHFNDNFCSLCTNCLLKNHHGMFCPICFDVYDDTPPPHLRLMCFECPSIAHRSCVVNSSNSDAPIPAFHCPSCADPKFSYFKVNGKNTSINEAKNDDGRGHPVSISNQNIDGEGDSVSVYGQNADEEGDPVSVCAQNIDGEGESVSVTAQNAQNSRAIDIESTKVICAAGKIAVSSIRKAVLKYIDPLIAKMSASI